MKDQQGDLGIANETAPQISMKSEISTEAPAQTADVKRKRGRPKLPPLSQREKCKYVHRLAPGEGKKRGRKPKSVQKTLLSTPHSNEVSQLSSARTGASNLIKSSFSSSSENESSTSAEEEETAAAAAAVAAMASAPKPVSTGPPSSNN